jgi:putative drug exporter of the RND superfamily
VTPVARLVDPDAAGGQGKDTVARFLDRLGKAAARRKWLTIGVWVLVAVALFGWAKAAGGKTVDVYTIPGAPSQEARDLLKERFPAQSGDTATIVFQARNGTIADPTNQAAIAQTETNLQPGSAAHVTQVVGPTTPVVGPAFVSKDGTIGYLRVQYDEAATTLPPDTLNRLEAAAQPAKQAGLRVEFGGEVTDYLSRDEGGDADTIGLVFAVIILLIAFGSVVAMSLPIGTALIGLAVGLSIISLIAAVTDVGTVAPTLATMIGLGVGIDYALIIVTRHRQNLAAGMEINESIGLANGTAGQAVLFAGGTVGIAITGLALSGVPYVTRLGLMAAIVVAVMMTAAVTLIPALLGLAGRHINRVHAPRLRRKHRGDQHPSLTGGRPRGWERWAMFMSRHRWSAVIVSLVILLALAAPALSMRLGQTDDGTLPENLTQRQAYDLVTQGFGPGANGPLLLVVSLPQPGNTAPADAVGQAVAKIPGVDVAPPQVSPDQTTAVLIAVPPTSPQSEQTENLVNDLRNNVLPPAVRGTGASVFVGGQTAAFIDLGERIQDRLPLFIGAVIGLSFLLLMMVFRSVLVPLKAAIMNVLSIAAAYGVIVAIFQWGWLKGLVGLDQTVPIVSFVPMIMFAILFGLSMDYEVFLLSRIREEYYESKDNLRSVVDGLGATARVITSAALIMISVFLSFVGDPDPTVKMFGVGLAVAVFVDATIVRLVLVPATMELLGAANWWLPGWLGRVLPEIHIEEGKAPRPASVPTGAASR